MLVLEVEKDDSLQSERTTLATRSAPWTAPTAV